jgi:hypothetical protein
VRAHYLLAEEIGFTQVLLFQRNGLVGFFGRYGEQYGFDYLMIAAGLPLTVPQLVPVPAV